MRFLLLPLLTITIIFAASSVHADECEQLPAPSVTVKRIKENISLNTRYGYRQLTHLGSDIARTGNVVLGLTRGKARARFSVSAPSVVDRTGRWECVSPQLTVTYGFSPMIVYVAREIPKGSCAYDEVFRHEMLHVDAYREHIAAIEKNITAALSHRFATAEVWRAPVGQTKVKIQRELVDRWMPYLEREINLGMAAQADIDAPEEYARVIGSCNGEIKRLINQ